jgi:hypothetical protein
MEVEENWNKIKIVSVVLFFPIFGILAIIMFHLTPLKQDIFTSVHPLLIQVFVTFSATLAMLIGLFYLIILPKRFEKLKENESKNQSN